MLKSASSLGNRLSICARQFPGVAHLHESTAIKTLANRDVQKVGSRLRAGDRVLLSWPRTKELKHKLTAPLTDDGSTIVDNHIIQHRHLIDQHEHTTVKDTAKDGIRHLTVSARHPSLDEFTRLAPRNVAPIYASYANTILSMLDIHVEPPSSANDPAVMGGSYLQILEAGTGLGSLSLHLAKAIAAANPSPPDLLSESPATHDEWQHWRHQRRAVLHTIDVDRKNTLHAEMLIKSYRSSLYWPHIDFHTDNVNTWLSSPSAPSNGFDVIVLDMPGVQNYISAAATALKPGGTLLIFVPQITQVAASIEVIERAESHLEMLQVLELGDGVSTGRNWDVRMAKPRKTDPALSDQEDAAIDSASEVSHYKIPPMVCRPRVGELTRGGGFVATWRKRMSATE